MSVRTNFGRPIICLRLKDKSIILDQTQTESIAIDIVSINHDSLTILAACH